MIINSSSLTTIFTGFNAAFGKGQATAIPYYQSIATTVPSTTGSEEYGWLGQFPSVREWLGQRLVRNLVAQRYVIENKLFESTIGLPRKAIEDDKYGLFTPVLEEMGKAAADKPNELVFIALAAGFSKNCYDGQFFFDSDHPVFNADGVTTSLVSNVQTGAGPAWYLLDTSRPLKPMIYQERLPYQLQQRVLDTDENVFNNDEFVYGVRGRSNVGYGLWQTAFGSKATLNSANYAAARVAMMSFMGDGGRPLGIRPDTLVVPPSLEQAGLQLLNSEYGTGGVTNEWKGTAKLIVTPWAS